MTGISRPDTQSTNPKARITEERNSNAGIRPDPNQIEETPDRNQINELDQFQRIQSVVPPDQNQPIDADNPPDLIEGESIGSYLIFKLDERLFKFRGQVIPAG